MPARRPRGQSAVSPGLALRGTRRKALTLVELLVAVSVMTILTGTLGMLASGIRSSSHYTVSQANTLQHARVILERIRRTVSEAYASPLHPGVAMVYETVGSYQYPDTLVVWRPNGVPANPNGPPLLREVVIFCPNPDAPNELLEITMPNDSRQIPLTSALQSSSWRAELNNLKRANSSQRVVLTDMLYENSVVGNSKSPNNRRGAARFYIECSPTTTQWSQYLAGTLAWANMNWPQDFFGNSVGMRQVWVRSELQMQPPGEEAYSKHDPLPPQVYFGSAALYYQLTP